MKMKVNLVFSTTASRPAELIAWVTGRQETIRVDVSSMCRASCAFVGEIVCRPPGIQSRRPGGVCELDMIP